MKKSLQLLAALQFDYPNGAIAGRPGGTFWDYKDIAPTGLHGFQPAAIL